MLKSSLLEIIRTFTPKELIKFEDFVNSPYHNKNKNVTNLFSEIKKYSPEYNHENLGKEKLWCKVFPDKEYNYGILKNIIHDLTKLSESFILLEKYSESTLLTEYDLIEALGGRNIQKIALAKIEQFGKKLETELEYNEYSSIDDYLIIASNFNFAKENFIHIYNLKSDKGEPIRLASDYIFYFFLIQSFKLINNTLSHELQGNNAIEKTLPEKILLKLEENSFLEQLLTTENKNPDKLNKIIICFYYMYKAISSNGNIDAYNKFISFLKENIDIFSGFELQNLNNCRQVCLSNLKLPYLGSAKESLDWSKFLIEKGALLERNGLLTHFSMSNLVSNAVALNEIEFAEKFVEEYSGKLPVDYRNNSYNYCLAVINFGKGDYGRSLAFLSNIRNEKLMLKYQSKKIYLKIYYELNDYESFLYAFDSFKHFKKRNKLSNETRAISYNMFGESVKSLFKLRNSFDKFESVKLRKDILNNINKDKSWLLEKLDELEKENI